VDQRLYEQYARIQDDHWWFVGRRKIISTVLNAGLEPESGDGRRILDVGCGTGTNLRELQRFGTVKGIDTEPAAVEFCHRQGESDVELVDGTELPFPGASFDLVTLLDVIEHVEKEQVLLSEVGRVLAPGGRILVTVPAYAWMWGAQDELSHHYRRYTRRGLLASFKNAGFEPLRVSYFNTFLFPPIAAIRLLRRLRPPPAELHSDLELNRPGPLNSLLSRLFGLEAPLLRRMNLAFGVSIIGLAGRRF
jgi:SAM-dependent methyltransferase